MSLAFAVGAKSVSSRPIAVSDALEELAEDGTRLLPVAPILLGDDEDENDDDDDDDDDDPCCSSRRRVHVYAATCLSSDRELQAIVTVTHCDMVWEDSQVQDCTVASVRVQVLPASEALSSTRHRETLHRIKLPVKGPALLAAEAERRKRDAHPGATLVAVFSADKLKLACLVPYPGGSNDSAVVVFQLRRPRATGGISSAEPPAAAAAPPLPSYVHLPAAHSAPIAPVATNPRIVPQTLSAQVSDLEDVAYDRRISGGPASVSAVTVPSILLAGCRDGTVLAISYRPLAVAGRFFESSSGGGEDGSSFLNAAGIRQLSHVSDSHQPGAEERTGVLAVIRMDESVTLCRTRMVAIGGSSSGAAAAGSIRDGGGEDPSHSSSATVMNDESDRSHRASHASFDAGSASGPPHGLYLSIRPVHTLARRFRCATWLSGSHLALVSVEQGGADGADPGNKKVAVEVWGVGDELSSPSPSSLLSRWDMTWHRLLEGGHHSSYGADEERTAAGRVLFSAPAISLHYDSYSDCIAISAYVSEMSGQSRVHRSFVCVWGWRHNYEGLLMTQTQPSLRVTPSFLMFAKSRDGGRKLIHTLAVRGFNGPRVRKDLYDTEILCSGTEGRETPDRLSQASNLLVGSSTVSYPVVEIVSSAGEFECGGFELCPEERLLLRDIFHYALKLDGSCRDDDDSDFEESSSQDSSSSSEARNYSMFCGVSRLFRRRPSGAPLLLNGNGTPLQNGGRRPIESGYGVVSDVILHEVLLSPSEMAWKRSFALASLLIGESTSGMHLCDAESFSRHLQRTGHAAVFNGDEAAVNARPHAAALVARQTHACRAALQCSESSVLLDLVLLLLGSPRSSEDSDNAVPGLLLLAIVTGYHCKRTAEFLSPASLHHPMVAAYEGAVVAYS